MAKKADASTKDPVVDPNPDDKGGETAPALDPDAALMVGGPQDTAAPELEEVEIGGRKFKVLKGQVGDLSESFKTTSDRLAESERALAELRAGTPAPVTPVVEGDKPDDIATMLFTDPTKAVAAIKEDILKEVTGMYQAEKTKDDFWDDFYTDHEDLKDSDVLVKAMATKHFSTLGPLTASKAGEELADLTRKEILRYVNKSKGGNSGGDRSTTLEGGRVPEVKTTPVEPEGPKSLSATIKARAAARRKSGKLQLAE